ncbi:hypothetical protein V8940_19865, partial [Acinetobacter pittii]|uniref:hypothetical protein n=1 Tax=Acinetobacter pittii TaxID=48296 RepID=UPI00300C8AA5
TSEDGRHQRSQHGAFPPTGRGRAHPRQGRTARELHGRGVGDAAQRVGAGALQVSQRPRMA